MMLAGEAGTPPVYIPHALSDRMAAMCLAYGIMTALFGREKLGRGQKVEVSLVGSMIFSEGFAIAPYVMLRRYVPRSSRKKTSNPLYNFFKCKDDRWIATGIIHSDRDFGALCDLMGVPELARDPRFVNHANRCDNCEVLVSTLDNVFATKTYREWDEILVRGDLPFSPLNDLEDIPTDPQLLANEDIVKWDHPVLGSIDVTGYPVKFSETPARLISAAPELGQHTEEVLQDVLGYNWDQIGELRESGAI